VTKTETRRRIKTPASTQERRIPAVTKQVTRRVVKTPATTQERVIPAVTKTITRRVPDGAPRVEQRVIPARYDTITVQKMVEAPRTETRVIPAQYGTIERRTQTTPERAEWRQVLCEANANTTVISAIQRALKTQGYYTGAIDGRLGRQTYSSVERFQQAKGLSTGGLTLSTVEALGVNWRSMVSGSSGVTSGGFTTGGTVSGGSTGFTTGTTVSGTTGFSSGAVSGGAAGYSIGADGVARNAAGAIVGRVDGSGNLVNSAGQIIARGVSGSSVGGAISGAAGSAVQSQTLPVLLSDVLMLTVTSLMQAAVSLAACAAKPR